MSTIQSISSSDVDMTIQCPSFELPESPLLSEDSLKSLRNYRAYIAALIQEASKESTAKANAPQAISREEVRQLEREKFYQGNVYSHLKTRYPVKIETCLKGGVYTETFLPPEGITQHNKNRVLVNLHGGGFCGGSRTNSHLESIPVAVLGKIKVVSVDYRMAPEHRFPAATDDVVAVYSALLQDYEPENIGIFGASSGAQLTAKTLVRLQEKNVALPGAVGMIAGGATRVIGDSVEFIGPMLKATIGMDLKTLKRDYFDGADLKDPRVTPALSDAYMSAFPPSLLVSSTRDYLLSSVVATHRQLIKLGVEADLHVWEGLDHVFHYNPDLPETRELHELIIAFFDKYLGGCS